MQKQVLRFLSLSYPPSEAFFWCDTNCRIVLSCLRKLYSIVGVITKERYGVITKEEDFFWYDNDKNLKSGYQLE